MTVPMDEKPTAPTASAADATEQTVQVVETSMERKDASTELTTKDGQVETKPKEEAKPSLNYYFRVFQYATPFDWFLMITSIVTSIGAGIALPLMNIVFGNLVGDFTNYFIPGTTVTKSQFQAEVNKGSLWIVYLFIAKLVLSYLSMLTIRISGLRISAAMRLGYLRALFAQPVKTIDTISPGKVSTRITTSSNTIQLAISQHLAMLFQSIAFTIALYVIAFIKGWLLTLVASASLPFIVLVYGGTIPVFFTIHKKTETLQEAASALAFEVFSSVRIVVAFGAEAKLARQHQELLDKAADNERKAAPWMGLMMSPSMMAMYGTFGLTFWFGIRQYSRGHIDDINSIVIVLFSVMMAVMNIGRISSPIMAITKAATAATELFVTIDAKVPDTSGLKEPDISADVDVQFEDVCFSYPSRPNVQILDGLNVRFEAGKVTAIVGPSGSGKSTIVSLLQRWYELEGTIAPLESRDSEAETKPAEKDDKKAKSKDQTIEIHPETANTCTGNIKVGNHDLRDVDLMWWRAQIGLVQQEPFLFNDTIFNNVCYGLCGTPHYNAPKEEKTKLVEEACKEAFAHEFISTLPLGYDTLVGESGIKLSGGQRQRIAIARSIIKRPPILILDEATSSIDIRTEKRVQEALDRVSKNRTTIVIAHRLSTIKRADKILVLRHGKLVEEGTHEELLKNDEGVYYGLVHAQELTMEAEAEADGEEGVELQKTNTVSTQHSAKVQDQVDKKEEETKEYKFKGVVRSVGRLVAEQRHHWILYTISGVGILGAGAVYPLQALIFGKTIEVFTFPLPKLVDRGNFWAGMFGVEALAVGIMYFMIGLCCHLISVAITTYYRQEYLTNLLAKPIPFHDQEGHSAGSLVSALSSDTTQVQQLMSTEMSMGLIACVNLIGSVAIAFAYGWKLSLVGLFCALPPILIAGYFRIGLEMKLERINTAVFRDSSQFASEAVGAFRTVLSLIMEDTITSRYHELLAGQVRNAFGSAKYSTLVFAASESVDLACIALAFWYGGTLLASREYYLVDFFVIYMGVIQGALAAGMFFSFAPNLAQAAGAANRILSMRPSSTTGPPKYDDLAPSPNGVAIELRNVTFTYPTRTIPVLSSLSLKIEPGQFIGLVGASGCGKSTIISLLERFYDPTSGTILFNDQDISTLDPAAHRAEISLVAQEPTLYEGSIRDNIALSVDAVAQDGNGVQDEAIISAAKAAQIHDFITSLPDGYSTLLGPKGTSLSGGQRQRLSLARALLRNPKLLLLDEATSSLDSESEKLVQDAIEKAAEGGRRTTIAVAHRLATIQKADVIFVLGSGRVLEKGGHQELLRRRGLYWQMCQAQALDR